jgi:hypothetical protein
MIRDVSRALGSVTPAQSLQTHARAVAEVAAVVRREAFVMAYSDCFFVMGIALVLCIFALPIIRRQQTPTMAH